MMDWYKEKMMGWNKYSSGDYTIEKEDTRTFLVWHAKKLIGVASSIPEAKAMARRHMDAPAEATQ